MARPTKYTPETVNSIVSAIALGAPYKAACEASGISEDTFARWRTQYPDFAGAVKEAEGRSVVSSLQKIEDAAGKDWKAAAWLLERRHPKDFGRREHVELSETNKHEADIEAAKEKYASTYQRLSQCSPEEARQAAEEAFPIAEQSSEANNNRTGAGCDLK